MIEKFIKAKLENFVTALAEYLENPEKLIFCTCNEFGNYIVQTLINNYHGDDRLERIVEVTSVHVDHQRKRIEDCDQRLWHQSPFKPP